MSDERRTVRSGPSRVLDHLPIDGPYPSIWMLDDRPGIWIVMGTDADGRQVIDLGRARSVRSGVFDHPAVLRWRAAGFASQYAACYTDDPRLLDQIEAALHAAGRPSAGSVG